MSNRKQRSVSHSQLVRREVLKLAGVGGVVFASGLAGCGSRVGGGVGASNEDADFFFMQISDTHWGFSGPPNPEADTTLKNAVAQINAAAVQPDFIVFTGDLTHTTDDPVERRARMREFKEIVSQLRVRDLRFLPGEHDASLDGGAAFRELIGPTRYTFDHKGVHFIALDNVSDPAAALGEEQLAWLRADLAKLHAAKPVVVLTHRPLFDLYPEWDWATADGAKAVDILQARGAVTVFYGHVHQEHHHMTGAIAHHAARSLIFPLPAPGAAPMRAPLPWDPASPDHGLGFRGVKRTRPASYGIDEVPYAALSGAVQKISARRFAFDPAEVTVKVGVPVVLELTSLDRVHGFNAPDLGLRAQIAPGTPTRLRFVPDRPGRFVFHCDVFCGDGHEGMAGAIVVTP